MPGSIMHTLLIKTAVLEKNPWAAMSMFNAWQELKQKCYERLQSQRVHGPLYDTGHDVRKSRPSRVPPLFCEAFKKIAPRWTSCPIIPTACGVTTRKFDPEEMFRPTSLAVTKRATRLRLKAGALISLRASCFHLKNTLLSSWPFAYFAPMLLDQPLARVRPG